MRLISSKEGLAVFDKYAKQIVRFNNREVELLRSTLSSETKHDYPVPEVVHLELTSRCNLRCSYCYVRKNINDLEVSQWITIINKLADSGVFQVTLGGGEPLLYPGLRYIVEHCNKRELGVTMTTNGILLSTARARNIVRGIDRVNVSFHGDPQYLYRGLRTLRKLRVPRGINYVVLRDDVYEQIFIGRSAKRYGAELLLLAEKPIPHQDKPLVSPEQVFKIAIDLGKCYDIPISVDGPCVNKCYAAKRFITVNCQGDVYPCSFVRESFGNLLEEEFSYIWDIRPKNRIKCPLETL